MKTFTLKQRIIGEGIPKICVPIVEKTREGILREAERIVAEGKNHNIDIVEFRGDFYENLQNLDVLKETMQALSEILSEYILLFTIRSEKEGGEQLAKNSPDIHEVTRFVITNQLSDMVDVELFSGDVEVAETVSLAKKNDVKVIMSNHDFKTTPEIDEIIKRLRMMQERGADIAKIAVMPENKIQFLNLLTATEIMQSTYAEIPLLTISMGKKGALSRVCGEIFGSSITFASLSQASAPGQIPVEKMNELLEFVHENMCE